MGWFYTPEIGYFISIVLNPLWAFVTGSPMFDEQSTT